MKLEVTHHDQRGVEGSPYGFLYFNDGRRMAYGLGKLLLEGLGLGIAVKADSSKRGLEGTGGWGSLSSRHEELAIAYAREHDLIDEK